MTITSGYDQWGSGTLPSGETWVAPIGGTAPVGGVTPGAIPSGFYGNGYFGDFVMDGVTPPPTFTFNGTGGNGMSYNFPQIAQNGIQNAYSGNSDLYFHNLTVNAGVGLFLAGDRLFVSGTLTLNGVIDFTGKPSYNGVQYASASGSTGGQQAGFNSDPVGQTAAGVNGGTGNGGQGGRPPALAFVGGQVLARQAGGQGGSGGAGQTGTAGSSLAPLTISEQAGWPFDASRGFGQTNAGYVTWTGGSAGGAGGGDGTNSGGGSGAGGGVVVVCARFITGSGIIQSPGGDGGKPPTGNCGGGGGGGGGAVFVTTQSAVWNPTAVGASGLGGVYQVPGITIQAPGGVGGAGVGTGAAGSAGVAGNTIIIPG